MDNPTKNEDFSYESIKKLIEQKKYEEADTKLTSFLSRLEKKYTSAERYFSFNHILDAYFYTYFKKDTEQLHYTEENISAFYRLRGFTQMHQEKWTDAVMSYRKALNWNPVDLDSLFQLCELYKKTGNLEGCLANTEEAYHYCSSRNTLAHFYRNLGFYALETYQTELASALYTYSNIYYPSKQAEEELKYLEKATGKPIPEYTLLQLQKILKENDIPLGPDKDTLGITYRVGQLEYEAGHLENAHDCFMMVYDLTQDEEVGTLLKEINSCLSG